METLTTTFNFLGDDEPLVSFEEIPENGFAGIASVFGSVVDAFIPTIIHRGAFKKTLQEQGRGVKILWQHDVFEPIGVPTQLFESDNGLEVVARLSRTQRGRDAMTLLRDGVVDAMSIGFDAVKFDMEEQPNGSILRHVREVRLWEISLVTFGADEAARITEINRKEAENETFSKHGFTTAHLEQCAITPFRNFPLTDRQRRWDSQSAESRVRTWAEAEDKPNSKYKQAFIFFDPDRDDTFGGYKLQIADIVNNRLVAVPRAIFAAAAALQGARGGVDIPEDDMSRARAHISRYYAKMRDEFDDETIIPPWEQQSLNPRDLGIYSRKDRVALLAHNLGLYACSTAYDENIFLQGVDSLYQLSNHDVVPSDSHTSNSATSIDADLALADALLTSAQSLYE